MLKGFIAIIITTMSFMIISCGDEQSSNGNTNIYNHISIKARSITGSEEEYTGARAVAYMNAKKVDEAIECLEEYLVDNPDALALKSLLVTAYFQKAGIDILTIITKFIKKDDYGGVNVLIEGEGRYNDLVTIVSKIVEDKEVSTEYMKKSDDLLKDIESKSTLDKYDMLKKTINKVVLVSLTIINLSDKFSQGFTEEDLDKISEEDAQELIDRLVEAQGTITTLPGMENLSDQDVQRLQEEISAIATEMDSGEGTAKEKLQNYMEKHYNKIDG